MPTHVESPRHQMTGGVIPKRVSPSVSLYGHYTIHFSDIFSGTLALERSLDNINWALVEDFGGESIVTMTHKRYQDKAAWFRFNGQQLLSYAGFKIFDHAEP